MGNRHPQITKSSGASVPYEANKLRGSLLRSGATEDLCDRIVRQVKGMLYPGITTEEIYRRAYTLLRAESDRHAGRYKLKQALLELGSSGFPFERFVGALLTQQGFEVEFDLILPGRCVKHELDVVAQRDGEKRFVECKYHQQRGQKTDVKVSLYIHARFQDLESQLQSHHPQDHPHFEGWIFTNTRFSDDAETYGCCAGLHLVSWDFPAKGNLKDMVASTGLYPISCLSTMTPAEKEELFNHNIVLCNELRNNEHTMKRAGLSEQRILKVLEEAARIIDGDH
jgi:Holliday junction resolvase-like predicted endonuclease